MAGWNSGGDTWLKGLVGFTQPAPDGSESTIRFGRQNDLIVSELQGKFYEGTKRGASFAVATSVITTTTIAAGNLLAAAAAAVTQFAIWNPSNSGKDVVLNKFFAQVASGTVPAGPLFHSFFNASGVSIASAGGIVNCYGGAGVGPAAKSVSTGGAGSAITGGAAPYVVRPSNINFSAGTYANLAGASVAMENIDGDLVLPPGVGWVPQWTGAGTTVVGWYGLSWFEVSV